MDRRSPNIIEETSADPAPVVICSCEYKVGDHEGRRALFTVDYSSRRRLG